MLILRGNNGLIASQRIFILLAKHYEKKRGLLASFVDVEGLERLDYLLRENTYSIACASNENLKVKAEINSLAQALHCVFSAHGDVEYSKLVVQLAQSTKDPSLRHIFESHGDSISLARRLLSMYIHHSTKDLVFKYIFPLVNIVQTSPQSYNFSAAGGNLSEEKIRNFQQLCSSFFRGINMMCENSTAGLQYLMVSLSLRVKNVLGVNSRKIKRHYFWIHFAQFYYLSLGKCRRIFR